MVAMSGIRVPGPGHYRLSFLVGGLLAEEAAIAAPVYLKLCDWRATRAALDHGNLLHCRTRASAVRTSRELVQRMQTLADAEVEYLASAPSTDRKLLLWVSACSRYEFVAEFAEEVLRDKFLLGVGVLATEDFERFWASKTLWHEELEALQPSTQRKLRTNLFLAMLQAGLLTEDGLIVSPLLSREGEVFLGQRTPSDVRCFPVGGAC